MPGRCHDSGAFSQALIYNLFETGQILPHDTTMIGQVAVPYHILGDSAFKLRPWLIKPYSASDDEAKINFNYIHSRTRRVIECTFGRCKGRWRRLQDCLHLDIQNVAGVVSAAFVMNNICEEFNEEFNSDWYDPIDMQNRRISLGDDDSDDDDDPTGENNNAKRIRDALKNIFNSN